MSSMVKKYVPYAAFIGAVYFIIPLFFVLSGTGKQQHPITYDIIFPLTAIVPSVIYGKKYGVDFFFSLVAPIIYIPSMLIYNGISINNIIFVAIYLVSSIFGLFFGDLFFGKKDNDTPPLDIDLDIEEDVKIPQRPVRERQAQRPTQRPSQRPVQRTAQKPAEKPRRTTSYDDDDFFNTYYSGKTEDVKSRAEDEVDKILRELQNMDI